MGVQSIVDNTDLLNQTTESEVKQGNGEVTTEILKNTRREGKPLIYGN